MNLEERVAKLERSNRRWRAMACIALVVAIGAGARQASEEPNNIITKHIQCESIEIHAAEFTPDGEYHPPLVIGRADDGGPSYGVGITLVDGTASLYLQSEGQSSEIQLSAKPGTEDDASGLAEIAITSAKAPDLATIDALKQIPDPATRLDLLNQDHFARQRSRVALIATPFSAGIGTAGFGEKGTGSGTSLQLHSRASDSSLQIMEQRKSRLTLGHTRAGFKTWLI